MKKLSLISLVLMAAIMFLFLGGCRKDEVREELKSSPEQNLFFNNDAYFKKHYPALGLHQVQSRNAEFEANLKEIQTKLKSLDDKHGIISNIVSKYGMPLWGRPIFPENIIGNLEFAYSFPLLSLDNDYVNGVLIVSKNNNDFINFKIQSDIGVFNVTKTNYNPQDLLSWVSLFYQHNLNISGKYKYYQLEWISKLIQENKDLVRPRNVDCFMDVVIHGTIDVHMGGIDISKCEDFAGGTKKPEGPSAMVQLVTIMVPIPDCTQNGDWDFVDFIENTSGGIILPKTAWEISLDIIRQKILECRSWAEDETGGVDVINGNPDYNSTADDAKHKTICERIKILDNCRGLDDDTKTALLTAIEMGLVPPNSLISLSKKHCGKSGLDEAIDAYINCPGLQSGENIFGSGNANFDTFLDSYMAIESFLADHPNDPVAAQLAVEMKGSLCGGSSTGGSGNALKKEDLEAFYLHEILKSKYADYIATKVNINEFISKYGREKYLLLANAYQNYNNLNLGITWNELNEALELWNNIQTPSNSVEEDVIDNGIELDQIYPVLLRPTGTPIGGCTNRGNTEDLSYGTTANDVGIGLNPTLSNSTYFIDMEFLFNGTTIFDSQLASVADQFIDQFRINNTTSFEMKNLTLNDKVSKSNKFRSFTKTFGLILQNKLKLKNGDITQVNPIIMDPLRPVFNTDHDKYHGLQILLNDTEETNIEVVNYEYDPLSKKWDGLFLFEISDHFGLDKRDALVYQIFHSGFAAWWRLQHKRGHVPFQTKIYVVAKLSGEL